MIRTQEIQNQYHYSTDLLKMQEKKKLSVEIAKKLYGVGLKRVSENILNCANYAMRVICPECGEVHHVNIWYCRERMCPVCQYKRSLKIKHNALDIVKRIEEGNPNGYEYIFVTLTMRNVYGEELTAAVDKLLNGWRDLIRNSRTFKKVAEGTIRTLEITYNAENNTYHPHIHAILAVPDGYYDRNKDLYLSQENLAILWKNTLDINYRPVVDIRAITRKDFRVIEQGDENTEKDIIIEKMKNRELQYSNAVSEVCKYAVKFNYSAAPGHALERLYYALKGRRLISYSGIFKIAKHELNIPDEPDILPDDNLNDFNVCDCGGRFLYELMRFDCGASIYKKVPCATDEQIYEATKKICFKE